MGVFSHVTQVEQFILNLQWWSIDPVVKDPPTASNMGRVWERLIRSARSILVALLKVPGTILNDESLCTFLAEVEAIVNTRPITSESLSDVHSPVPLSPMQSLTMKSRVVMPPPGEFQKEDIYCRKQWRRVQHLANEFWSRWKKEVYAVLVCHKWNKTVRNFKVGDIVLLGEETSRNKWPVGRVIAIQEGNASFVRSVNIVVGTNTFKTFGTRILERLQVNVCCLLKVRMKIILNNNIELKMKYLEGRNVLM